MARFQNARERVPITLYDTVALTSDNVGPSGMWEAFSTAAYNSGAWHRHERNPHLWMSPGDTTVIVRRLEVYYFGLPDDVSVAQIMQGSVSFQVGSRHMIEEPLMPVECVRAFDQYGSLVGVEDVQALEAEVFRRGDALVLMRNLSSDVVVPPRVHFRVKIDPVVPTEQLASVVARVHLVGDQIRDIA